MLEKMQNENFDLKFNGNDVNLIKKLTLDGDPPPKPDEYTAEMSKQKAIDEFDAKKQKKQEEESKITQGDVDEFGEELEEVQEIGLDILATENNRTEEQKEKAQIALDKTYEAYGKENVVTYFAKNEGPYYFVRDMNLYLNGKEIDFPSDGIKDNLKLLM